jgi:hypothetical protein
MARPRNGVSYGIFHKKSAIVWQQTLASAEKRKLAETIHPRPREDAENLLVHPRKQGTNLGGRVALLGAQRDHWIHFGRSTRRQNVRQHRSEDEQGRRACEYQAVMWFDAEQ